MLRWRIPLAALLIAAFACLFWLDDRSAPVGLWFTAPVLLLLSLAASQELLALLAARSLRPAAWVVYVGNLFIVAANWAPLAFPRVASFEAIILALTAAMFLAFIAALVRFDHDVPAVETLAAAAFAFCYVGLLLSFIAQLRLFGGGQGGIIAVVGLVIVVKLGDTGAFTVGRLVGRRRLAPRISPGKTVEGCLGGLAFSCLGAWLTFGWLAPLHSAAAPATPWWGWVTFGLAVGAAGIVGDLAESMLKRTAGRKDSSDWLPGMGGVLDVLDSLLFAAPVAYLCCLFQLVYP